MNYSTEELKPQELAVKGIASLSVQCFGLIKCAPPIIMLPNSRGMPVVDFHCRVGARRLWCQFDELQDLWDEYGY